MRAEMHLFLSGLIVGVSFASAGAQEGAPPCTPGVMISGLRLGPGAGRASNLAYSATVKATFEQRLADGDVITGEQVTHVAENAAGWTRQEIGAGCIRDADDKPRLDLIVTVTKGKGETLSWIQSRVGGHVVTFSHPVEATPEQLAEQVAKPKALPGAVRPDIERIRKETKTESLGSAVIAGFEATGTRTIRTYPPGEEGNSIPLVVTTETWTSKDGFWVKWVQDDPRKGKSTIEIETVTMGEPDASLFSPPAGYTVKDAPYPAPVAAVTTMPRPPR